MKNNGAHSQHAIGYRYTETVELKNVFSITLHFVNEM